MGNTSLSDAEILTRFREPEGQNYAFNLLVRKYQQKLYWVIRRMVIDHDDSDDLLQNVWVKVWQNLGNFKAESQLYTWLYRIAANESLTFLSSRKKRFFFSLNDVEKELEDKVAHDPAFNGDEIQLKLQKAILTLPEKQRIVFQLRYYDEMPYEDMSKVLDTSVGALKASYHHAAKKVENYLTASH
jgi:RNA polymerase sigma-70 factor (ECF subfamily)